MLTDIKYCYMVKCNELTLIFDVERVSSLNIIVMSTLFAYFFLFSYTIVDNSTFYEKWLLVLAVSRSRETCVSCLFRYWFTK